MIYLFNSACKPSYYQNVYCLLGMPSGARREMRYTIGQNAPPVDTDSKYRGKHCTICYVDRFADGGYKFFPFRMGTVKKISRSHGRVYYEIELGDHCHSESPDDFTSRFYSKIDDAPTLVVGAPESNEDGIYCVSGSSFSDLVKTEQDSWSKAVDQILETKCFSGAVPAFFLTEVIGDSGSVKADNLGLKLKADTDYTITVTYNVRESPDPNVIRKINVRIGDDVNHEIVIGSKSDRFHVPIKLPPITMSSALIHVRTSAETIGSSGGEVLYSADIHYRTRTWAVNLTLIIFLFVAVLAKELFQSGWQFGDGRVWLTTLFETGPFAILLWAMYKFRGQLKLPGL